MHEEGENGRTLVLLAEHVHAGVDLKRLFKAHERGELEFPLYLRLQILWECAHALRTLHNAGLAHGSLHLTSIKVSALHLCSAKNSNFTTGFS